MMFDKSHEYEQLDSISDEFSVNDQRTKKNIWRRAFFTLLALCVLAVLGLGIWFFQVLLPSKVEQGYRRANVVEPYSPAAGSFTYENRFLNHDPDTPKFVGEPRPELDQAWHEMLQGTLIRVSEKELNAANATSIPLKDGGYAVGLGVSHSLHCLKRIKQYFHKEYYYSHEAQDWAELEMHVDHCLESLRQILMCQVDTSLYTLEWTTHSKWKPAVRVPQPHACASFDMLHDWMLQRAVSIHDLVRPSDEFFEGREYSELSGTVKSTQLHDHRIRSGLEF